MAGNLDTFDPAKAGKYDPGRIVVFFDNRTFKSFHDQHSLLSNVYLEGLSRLGWAGFTNPDDIEPGKLRMVFYTHAGNEGKRDFPLWQAREVREAFDELSREGFRPVILGWSKENPFPDIGGSEPPPPPAKPKEPKRATTYSASMSGHSKDGGETPHDRIMNIIQKEDEMEAKLRAEQVQFGEKEKFGGAA